MTDFFPMPGCRVDQVTLEVQDSLHIAAHGLRPSGRCPDCGRASQAVHSRYRRKPADLPTCRATAILYLLLIEPDAPLVIDQPEDNLDNRFISDGIVPRVKAEKLRRQFIFASHNANTPPTILQNYPLTCP